MKWLEKSVCLVTLLFVLTVFGQTEDQLSCSEEETNNGQIASRKK
jgi:hypothetical protein